VLGEGRLPHATGKLHLVCIIWAASGRSPKHQVRNPKDLDGLDGIVLPGGESTAMGLIGTTGSGEKETLWHHLQRFSQSKPTWGTCAGMILLAERCIGTSAVIEDGQALIGGLDVTVCRNYFGSQISSFEMFTPPPPGATESGVFPGVFIRAPAILSAGSSVEVLGKVMATPCRQAAATLAKLEERIAKGENVVKLKVADADDHNEGYALKEAVRDSTGIHARSIVLPGAADESNSREVICAVKTRTLLCTAFHPEITDDLRWHKYFVDMVIGNSKYL